MDTNAWTLKLSESLSRQLQWQNIRGLGIVTLAGQLAATAFEDQSFSAANSIKRLRMGNNADEKKEADEAPSLHESAQPKLMPTLDALPPNVATATRAVSQPLHVGDLRLADLRKLLQTSGHTADFRGEGTLLIDGLVAVRKSGAGKIEVEGGGLNLPEMKMRSLEGTFHTVKRQIYDELAVIAGG